MQDWAYMQYEYGGPVSDVNYPFCLSSKSQLLPALLSWLFGTGNQKKHPPIKTTKNQTKNTNNYN